VKGIFRQLQLMDLRQRGRILVLFSLALGLGAGLLAHSQMQSLEAQLGSRADVLVAKRDITAETVIEPDLFTTKSVPLRFRLSGMVSDMDRPMLTGRVALVPIKAGHVVTSAMFAARRGVSDSNQRVYTLTASSTVIIGAIELGDQVDVLAVYEDRTTRTEVAEISLEGIKVLSVSQPGRPPTVSLSLTPEQAQRLAWYESFGKQIRLLRQG